MKSTNKILINLSKENSALWNKDKAAEWDLILNYFLPTIKFYTSMKQIDHYIEKIEKYIIKQERRHISKKIYLYVDNEPIFVALLYARFRNNFAFVFPCQMCRNYKVANKTIKERKTVWKIFDPWEMEKGGEDE